MLPAWIRRSSVRAPSKGFLYGIYKGVTNCHLGLGRSMALLTVSALGLLLAPGFRGLAVVSVVF